MFLYDISAFMLYFIFYFSCKLARLLWNFLLWRHPVTITSLNFLTDSNENCTAYVKLNSKIILFVELFWFSEYLLRKLQLLRKSHLLYSYPTPLLPSPLGRPLGWLLLGTHLSHTWGYFFSKKKYIYIIYIYLFASPVKCVFEPSKE